MMKKIFANPEVTFCVVFAALVVGCCLFFLSHELYYNAYLKPWRVRLYQHSPWEGYSQSSVNTEVRPEVYLDIALSVKHTKRGVDKTTSYLYLKAVEKAMEDGVIFYHEYHNVLSENDRMLDLIREKKDKDNLKKYKDKLKNEL